MKQFSIAPVGNQEKGYGGAEKGLKPMEKYPSPLLLFSLPLLHGKKSLGGKWNTDDQTSQTGAFFPRPTI